MATQVQKKKYGSVGDSTSHSIVLDGNPVQGNLLVVCIVSDAAVTVAPSGYTLAVFQTDFVDGNIYYKIAGAGESPTISITIGASTSTAMQAFEYSGMKAVPLDQVESRPAQGVATTINTNTTPSTTQANELIFVAACLRFEPGTQTITAWDNGFTSENEAVTTASVNINLILNVATKTVSATGTYTANATMNNTGVAGHDVGLIATFNISDSITASLAWITA